MNYFNHTTPLVLENGNGGYEPTAIFRDRINSNATFYRTLDNGVNDRFEIHNGNVGTYRPTVVDVPTGGSLLANTTYNLYAVAGNKYGPGRTVTTATAGQPVSYCSVTTANDGNNTHVARLTIPQVPAAEYYDIHNGTTATTAPFIARITEAQRAAGCTITALRTISATSPGINKVDVNIVGSGAAVSTSNIGLIDWDSIPEINTNGYSNMVFVLRLSGTIDYLGTYGFGVRYWFYSDELNTWFIDTVTSSQTFTASRYTSSSLLLRPGFSRSKLSITKAWGAHVALPRIDVSYILS